MKNMTLSQKLVIDPMPMKKNSNVTISYNGQLTSIEKNKVYIHYGYGANMAWNQVGQQEMTRSPKGYTTTILVNGEDRLNLCFHDNQGHWDNNSGNNWSYEIR